VEFLGKKFKSGRFQASENMKVQKLQKDFEKVGWGREICE
jgi:hypothetical protein